MKTLNSRILLAEDEPDDVLLTQRAFKKAGIANWVYAVPDGQEAVDYLAGTGKYADRERYPTPMLLLLDLNMPRRSGLSVLKWLRGTEAYQYLPVVILTGSNHPADIQSAHEMGADSYLLKPVNFDALAPMVEAVHLKWLELNQRPQIRMIVEEATW